MSYNSEFRPPRVAAILIIAAVLLVVAHLAGLLLESAGFGGEYSGAVIRRFNLDEEGNIPTFFSSVLLLISAALLLTAGEVAKSEGSRWVSHWRWLALIFVFLSLDEMTEVHGLFTEINRVIDTGIFRFAWVLVYGPLVMVFGLVYLRFLLALPSPTRLGFTIAGLVYVGGALGMEIVGGAWSSVAGEANGFYRAITTVEETMELAGLIAFVHALLLHTQLRFAAGSEQEPAPSVAGSSTEVTEKVPAVEWRRNGSGKEEVA